VEAVLEAQLTQEDQTVQILYLVQLRLLVVELGVHKQRQAAHLVALAAAVAFLELVVQEHLGKVMLAAVLLVVNLPVLAVAVAHLRREVMVQDLQAVLVVLVQHLAFLARL
jgi:Flp pilus assembly protein TadB